MTRGYRQPLPAWRRQQLAQREVDQEMAHNDKVGDIMGLPGPAFEDDQPAPAARQPIAQTEHHSIGKDFLLAGRAVFTVAGKDKRFTFRINRKESQNARYPEPSYFVSVRTGGADAEHAYTYMAILDTRTGTLRFTTGSKITAGSPAAVALAWTLRRVWAGLPLPAPAAIYHEGRCGRCGRPLTVPESILTGFGPDCAELVGKTYLKDDTDR